MKIITIIGNYHRKIIWYILGFLFLLDVITTHLGLQKGGFEQTLFMIPYVENPILHFFLKIFVFGIIFIPVEFFLKWLIKKITEEEIKLNKSFYIFCYLLTIYGLIQAILFFLYVNITNIYIISQPSI